MSAHLGAASTLPPNNNDPAGTVAVVCLYGPRGGYIGDAALDLRAVERLIVELQDLRAAEQRRAADAWTAVATRGFNAG